VVYYGKNTAPKYHGIFSMVLPWYFLTRDKIGIMPRVALCSLYVPKIIKFYRCIQLLQAKMKVGPFNLAHPVPYTTNFIVQKQTIRNH